MADSCGLGIQVVSNDAHAAKMTPWTSFASLPPRCMLTLAATYDARQPAPLCSSSHMRDG